MLDDEDAVGQDKDFDDERSRRWFGGIRSAEIDGLPGPDRPRAPKPGPGVAARVAAGDHRARPAAAAVNDDAMARDNWRPTGPRNVGGRVRALAITPGHPQIMFAGAASGGVYKSVDGAESWFPLMHDQPSLAIGALAVGHQASTGGGHTPADADAASIRVYAATGEIVANGFAVRGFGIWVSSDAGATWTNHDLNSPLEANPPHRRGFDAIAVDPADDDHCWAVGAEGVYRTVNAGVHWTHFQTDEYWSDVHFHGSALFLARGNSDPGAGGNAVVVRLDNPGTATAPLVTAANTSELIALNDPDTAWPERVKMTVAVDGGNTLIFARVVDQYGHHLGIWRTTQGAAAPFSGAAWERLPDHRDWADEDQGTYDLCIAVDPDHPGHLATGTVQVWASRNATAASVGDVEFVQIMEWQLHDEGLRAHHADHHQLVVSGDQLWVADDGGIAMSENWKTGSEVDSRLPLALDAVHWQNRDDGITAAQFYDLGQSPLLPSVYGGGLQDNGVHMTSGGPTWRNIFGADGGFVLFDPDDAYAMILTWYGGVESLRFPSHLDRTFADEQPPGPFPSTRPLRSGFERFDPPAFIADADYHPRDRSRVLTAARQRLYGLRSATGEEWQIESVGRGIELRLTADVDDLTVTLADTPAAHRLGLLPGTVRRRRFDDPDARGRPRPNTVGFFGRIPEPFVLATGDQLQFTVNGDARTATFDLSAVADPTATMTGELLVGFTTASPGTRLLPRFWSSADAVELITTATGTGATITLGGSALAPIAAPPVDPAGLSRLGVNVATYTGSDGLPASITIGYEGDDHADRTINRDLSNPANQTLTVSADGGATTASITFGGTDFPDPSAVTAGELAAALTAQLPADQIRAVACSTTKAVIIRARPSHSIVITGTAADRLGIPTTPAAGVSIHGDRLRFDHQRSHRRNHNSFDLDPRGGPALTIAVTDGTNPTGDHAFVAAGVGDLRCVTAEELYRILTDHLAASSIEADVELVSQVIDGQPNEIRFSQARPDEVWIGSEDGLVHRSTDDGATWSTLGERAPDADPDDGWLDRAGGRTEAIALHPTDPDVAYVAHWTPRDLPVHQALVHRTSDGGRTWAPIGIVNDGAVPAVHALEMHPDDPAILFAATDVGVFWTRDEGTTWAPFNHGLPNTSVTDLILTPTGPTLRAAAWGRGVYERSISTAPPDDVRLLLRHNELDDGSTRPAPAGPDVFALDSGISRVPSPDLKVVRNRPAGIGSTDPLVDGVEFDLEVVSEPVVPATTATVMVQIHNRGSQPARSGPDAIDPKVRVVVLWAPLDDGALLDGAPPDLPVDFWTQFRLGTPLVGLGQWNLVETEKTLLGDLVSGNPTPRDVTAGEPEIIGFTITWPAITADRVALLAIVSGDDDEITGGPIGIDALLAAERRVAYREAAVVQPDPDRTLLLQSTGSEQFQVVTAGGNVADRLGIAAPLRDSDVAEVLAAPSGAATYDLDVATPRLIIAAEPRTIDIPLDNANGEFARLDQARPVEIAGALAARLDQLGVPVGAFPTSHGVRIQTAGDISIEVMGGSAAAPLGFTAGAQTVITTTTQPNRVFDLATDLVLELRLRAHGAEHDVSVTFDAKRFSNPTFARGGTVARLINEALAARDLDGAAAAYPIYGLALLGRSENANTVEIEALATAQAVLGFDPAAANFIEVAPGVVDLSAKPTVGFRITNRTAVDFERDPAADPALVRQRINRAMELARIPVRARTPRVALRVRSSTTDPSDPRPALGRTGLAEVAVEVLGSVDPAARPALFGARRAIAEDRVDANLTNFFYVRAWNEGNVTAPAARVRLFRVDIETSPIVPAPIGSAVDADNPAGVRVADVAAGGNAIVEFDYTDLAAPAVLFVLAVVDGGAAGPTIAVPGVDSGPGFADQAALLAFHDLHTSVGLRQFAVIP